MSKMALLSQKKRKVEDGMKGRVQKSRKRLRKQQEYHSSSEDESSDEEDIGFAPIHLENSEDEAVKQRLTEPSPKFTKDLVPTNNPGGPGDNDEEATDGEGTEEDSDATSSDEDARQNRQTSKRNDPNVFSTSMSRILSTKVSQAARKDPMLSKSRAVSEASHRIADDRLEAQARAKLRAERKQELDRGRTKDVLGTSTGQSQEAAEEEKRLRKVAQRGVVKLFNAVRAAQVRGEQALKEERKKGTIGQQHREEKVHEMSKQGFLDLITGNKDSKPQEA